MVANTTKAWLLYSTDETVIAFAQSYADVLENSYQWDNTVQRHADVKVGDMIGLWDGKRLLGVSVIEKITESDDTKIRLRCPFCKTTDIRKRKKELPLFKCGDCGTTFEKPDTEEIEVKSYIADYSKGWQYWTESIEKEVLREMCINPKSQHSIRELNVSIFQDFVQNNAPEGYSNLLNKAQRTIKGGHLLKVAKMRIGQGEFRKQLLNEYGANCAISGPAPERALHACHLYSYADKNKHAEGGGLLLRADLHSLFDSYLLTIDAKSGKVILDPKLERFPNYWRFNNTEIKVPLTKKQESWLLIRTQSP